MLARQAINGNLGTGPENPWKIRKIPVIGSGSGTGAKLSLAVAFVPLVSYVPFVPSKGTRDLRDTRDKSDDISRRLRTKISRAIGTRQSGAEPQLMPSLGSLWSLLSLQRLSKQKKLPATSYSRTGESRTTLGDGALNFCVRNGNRCDNPSMVTGKKPFE